MNHYFEKLSLEELYAAVLKKDPDSALIKELAAKYSPRSLFQTTIHELQEIHGIGEANAMQIKALLELNRRIIEPGNCKGETCNSPQDVASLLMAEMQLLDREHFKVIALNTKNKVICIDNVAIGSLSSSLCHPREIFKNAIKLSAAAIILIHNHPSGDPTASREDIEATKRLVEVGKVVGISVLDHIIIGDGNYFSFKEKGMLE